VLTRGPAGSWDSVDVLNPSVIRWKGKLYNYYSGYDGAIWRTGLATSQDNGLTWTKYAYPVLQPDSSAWDVKYIAANGAALVFDSKIYLYYHGWDRNEISRIGLAISDDGITFSKMSHPILDAAATDQWDAMVADPYVIQVGRTVFLYYLGLAKGYSDSGIGVATSRDGIHWIKAKDNPIIKTGSPGDFEEGVGEPSVFYQDPFFYMLYTASKRNNSRDIAWAISTDGLHWQKKSLGLFNSAMRQPWFSQVICDTTILPARNGGGTYYVWFGGGDLPSPDHNLHGVRDI
jgi:predicted GH43/DUF377 family glycosyl hydrolase